VVASDELHALDGGGCIRWLTGVKPTESVALLATYVRGSGFEITGIASVGNGALTAIALHADASADRALESFVTPERSAKGCGGRQHSGMELRGAALDCCLAAYGENGPSSDVRAHVSICAVREPRSWSAG